KLYVTDVQDQEQKAKLSSILESNDLDAFMFEADLQGRKFAAEKQNIVVLDSSSFQAPTAPSTEVIAAQLEYWEQLKIPRRHHFSVLYMLFILLISLTYCICDDEQT